MTVGGAVVLDPEPPAGAIRRSRAGDRMMALTTDDPAAWAATIIAEAGIRGVTAADLARRGGLSAPEAEQVVRGLVERGRVIAAADTVLDAEVAADAQAAIIKLLTTFHRSHPSETGMPRDQLLSELSQHLPEFVDRLTPEGRLPSETEASQWT